MTSIDDGYELKSILKSKHRHGNAHRRSKHVTFSDTIDYMEPAIRSKKPRIHVSELSKNRKSYVPLQARSRPHSSKTKRYAEELTNIIDQIPSEIRSNHEIMRRIAILQKMNDRIELKMEYYHGLIENDKVYFNGKRKGRFYFTPSMNKHYL